MQVFSSLRSTIRPRTGLGNLPVPALLAFFIVCGFTASRSPEFLSIDNFVSIADSAAVPVVIVCGLSFVVLMGSIDLSVQGVIATAALTAALLAANDRNANNLGYWAILVSVLIGGVIGGFAGLAVTRMRIPSFLVTIATWNIGLGIAYVLFGNESQPSIADEGLNSIGFDSIAGLTKSTWIAIAMMLFSLWLQRYSKFGRYAYVIGGSEEIALLSGINVKRYRVLALTFSGACSGLAGAVIAARSGMGSVMAGDGQLFFALASVVIGGTVLSGGKGGVLHSVVGVLIMITLGTALILLDVSDFYQEIVQGVVVLIVVAATAWRSRRPLRTVV